MNRNLPVIIIACIKIVLLWPPDCAESRKNANIFAVCQIVWLFGYIGTGWGGGSGWICFHRRSTSMAAQPFHGQRPGGCASVYVWAASVLYTRFQWVLSAAAFLIGPRSTHLGGCCTLRRCTPPYPLPYRKAGTCQCCTRASNGWCLLQHFSLVHLHIHCHIERLEHVSVRRWGVARSGRYVETS